MSELRIVRGTDIRMFADDTPLFGVTAFSAAEKPRYHEVYEYLSAQPCDFIRQDTQYEIKLWVMALFDQQLSCEKAFELRIIDDGAIYAYENCRIIENTTAVKGNGRAEAVFTLAADSMRRRCQTDE